MPRPDQVRREYGVEGYGPGGPEWVASEGHAVVEGVGMAAVEEGRDLVALKVRVVSPPEREVIVWLERSDCKMIEILARDAWPLDG